MKSRSLIILAATIAAFITLSATSATAQQTNVSATLIFASSQGDGIDPALRAYESNLKRLFKYSSYQLRGKSNARLSVPGNASMNLSGGHRVELVAQESSGNKVRLSVKWSNQRRMLFNTTINQDKGKPIILGGPSAPSQNGNLILVLVPR
ncbi:MAG TPA: hypothetical protein DIV79_08730 [Opitutae bacterium]|nr:hypothetical protein [Opitutae bacterium]